MTLFSKQVISSSVFFYTSSLYFVNQYFNKVHCNSTGNDLGKKLLGVNFLHMFFLNLQFCVRCKLLGESF